MSATRPPEPKQGEGPHCSFVGRVGDKGQRYEVRAHDEAESQQFVVGWTNDPTGGALVKMVNAHPSWHTPVVIDRAASAAQENPSNESTS